MLATNFSWLRFQVFTGGETSPERQAVLDFVRLVWHTGEIPQAWADVPVVTIPKMILGWRMIALDARTHKVQSSIINSRLEQ